MNRYYLAIIIALVLGSIPTIIAYLTRTPAFYAPYGTLNIGYLVFLLGISIILAMLAVVLPLFIKKEEEAFAISAIFSIFYVLNAWNIINPPLPATTLWVLIIISVLIATIAIPSMVVMVLKGKR